MDSDIGRRELLGAVGAVGAVGALGVGGCLTARPTVETGDIGDSKVFKRIEAADWLADTYLSIDVKLKPAATDPAVVGVKRLAVVGRDGEPDWESSVKPGTTTKKATVLVDEPSTLVALGTDGTPIERVAVAVEGTSLP
jgi:hypothetical protein